MIILFPLNSTLILNHRVTREKDIAMAESMDQFASDLMPFKDSFPSTPTSIPDEINIEAFKARWKVIGASYMKHPMTIFEF